MIKVKNISEYCKNKQVRLNTAYHINSKGEGFFRHEGRLIKESEFYALFPLELYKKNYKGDNPDGTKIK